MARTSSWAETLLGLVRAQFVRAGEPARAAAMAEYMRDQFRFFGVPSPERKRTPSSIPLVEHLVTTQSSWDTVDEIASHAAGGIVSAHPETVSTMDGWAQSDHTTLARTAILHQLRYKADTDAHRLFDYCLTRADEQDFFYRKAIGWAPREYAKTDAEAVRTFCDQHESRLSALSLREARKRL